MTLTTSLAHRADHPDLNSTDEAISLALTLMLDHGLDHIYDDSPQNQYRVDWSSASMNAGLSQDRPILTPDPSPHKVDETSTHHTLSFATLDDLRAALLSFEGCALKKTATQLVFGDGQPASDVMFIGEAPGADEDRLGRPFVGLSGRLLDTIAATIGLRRQDNVYITNIVPWRPPGNRQPSAEEIALCLPFLHHHILLIKPKIIVLWGGVAAKTILGTSDGILKLRGRWHTYRSPVDNGFSCQVMPTFHPAYLLRSPSQKRLVWRDMLMVRDGIMGLS